MKKSLLTTLLFLGIFLSISINLLYNKSDGIETETPNISQVYENGDNPEGRVEQEFMMLRDPVTNKVPADIFRLKLEFAKNLPQKEVTVYDRNSKSTKSITWTERGPNNIGGRTRALAIDTRTNTSPNITILAGGVSGGIWKSTDDGSTWTEKTTPGQLHNATCIVQDTRSGHEDTWYV
jgi:hypothetical protein